MNDPHGELIYRLLLHWLFVLALIKSVPTYLGEFKV
jgi:hypothetical protein